MTGASCRLRTSAGEIAARAAAIERRGTLGTGWYTPGVIRALQVNKVYKSYPGPFALLRELSSGRPSHRRFAALESVSFQVGSGESFGIVGNNGAGKTTLLKILAGACVPTGGDVRVEGRVAALLELGVGFDPEFTGRRNLYFGGALAGFSREEIARRESGIIEFSGLGGEIDRPVKTYSAGMMLRLAFSLATSFEPEVLIVDEVLAVGDGEFQSRCLDRIQGLRDRGCTAVLCSHALHQIEAFCSRALWLHRGRVQAMGPSREVVGRYRDFCQTGSREWDPAQAREGGSRKICWIEEVKLGRPRTGSFRTGDSLELDVSARFLTEFRGTPGLGVAVVRDDGVVVYVTSTIFDGVPLEETGPGEYRARLVLPRLALLEGRYYFNVVATDTAGLQSYDLAEKKEPFSVTHSGSDSGLLRLQTQWGQEEKREKGKVAGEKRGSGE